MMVKSRKNHFRELVPVSHRPEKQLVNNLKQPERIRLADFIHDNTEKIVSEWEIFAQTLTPAANDMTSLALRNHIHEILTFVISDMKSPQTPLEQVQKSQGRKEKSSTASAAETHAGLRLAGGFDIDQMVSEFRSLRASVVKLWSKANAVMNNQDIVDLTRFDESIDQELAESVSVYTRKVTHSRDMFVGVLSHDLGTPLNAISMCAQLIVNTGASYEQHTLYQRQKMLATQIFESASRITVIVKDLLDVTRARFGAGLPVLRAAMDMGFVSRQLVDEIRVAHPRRNIILDISGNLKGEWDKARIGQVFTNLIGNAIQYGFKDSSIDISVKGARKEVILSVHNEGVPVPPGKLGAIFNSLTRATAEEDAHPAKINLGLGLYITKEIVVSHGGEINVTSSEKDGTTFTARFPR